ncbi:MAG: hypothetical protein U9O89_01610 [Thermoproteota archaeon]|nr:hypothetical protein [Thermoproteota archaeon]
MRSLLWSKKGITPVLSNLLLTVVAVAAMSIAATATYVISNNLRENMGERFIVEDVWFKTGGEIGIYIRNTGKVSIEVASVYLNRTPQLLTQVEFGVGEHGWLNITYDWNPSSVYHLNVVTKRGTRVEDYYKTP